MTHKLLAKYLFNEASVKETAKVEKWLQESEANPIELEILRERLELATHRYRANTFLANRALEKLRHTIRKPISRLQKIFRYSAAALFILTIGSGLFYYFRQQPVNLITVRSQAGQTLICYLPDSTQVTLAASSVLRYPSEFTGNARTVSMSGKLFFKVHRDEAHPFMVETPSVLVKVLGTSFQVEASAHEAQILVKKGKVAVFTPDGQQQDTLIKGMSCYWSVGKNKLITQNQFDPNLMAWKTKELRFQNTVLSEVIQTLNEYYQVNIILPESYKNLRLTATFKHITLSKALEIINKTLDIHLNYTDK